MQVDSKIPEMQGSGTQSLSWSRLRIPKWPTNRTAQMQGGYEKLFSRCSPGMSEKDDHAGDLARCSPRDSFIQRSIGRLPMRDPMIRICGPAHIAT